MSTKAFKSFNWKVRWENLINFLWGWGERKQYSLNFSYNIYHKRINFSFLKIVLQLIQFVKWLKYFVVFNLSSLLTSLYGFNLKQNFKIFQMFASKPLSILLITWVGCSEASNFQLQTDSAKQGYQLKLKVVKSLSC